MRQKGGITAYAKQRVYDIASSFKCIFDQSMGDSTTAETNREGRKVKGINGKILDL